jgi:hypothetical protein
VLWHLVFMVLAYAVIVLIVLALLLRRDLSAIGRIPYRGGWKLAAVVAGLFALQAALILYAPPAGQTTLQKAVLILSQIALIFITLLNHRIPGAKLFALGIILNTTVMAANGGWMPVTPETDQFVHPQRVVEVQERPPSSKGMIIPRAETNLWILSDIIRVSLPGRRTAMSLGDLLLILGAAQFIFQSTSRSGRALPDDDDNKVGRMWELILRRCRGRERRPNGEGHD